MLIRNPFAFRLLITKKAPMCHCCATVKLVMFGLKWLQELKFCRVDACVTWKLTNKILFVIEQATTVLGQFPLGTYA